jgi:hypothetical protein
LEAATLAPPHRSAAQRTAALKLAQEVRIYRARRKREIKRATAPASRAQVVAIVLDPPELMLTMHISDLLVSVRGWAKVRAEAALRRCQVSPHKTLGGLTYRQRRELVRELGR